MSTEVYTAIARNLREFGYSDVTWKMVEEVHEAMKQGKRKFDLPHGIIGPFAENQINDAIDQGLLK